MFKDVIKVVVEAHKVLLTRENAGKLAGTVVRSAKEYFAPVVQGYKTAMKKEK